jgi:hypothetical protein
MSVATTRQARTDPAAVSSGRRRTGEYGAVLLGILLILSVRAPVLAAPGQQLLLGTDTATVATYRVTVEPPVGDAPPVIHVEARLPAATRSIAFPGPGVGIEPAEWQARWVRDFSVRRSDGRAVSLRRAEAEWAVAPSTTGLLVSYTVDTRFARLPWPAGNEHAGYYEAESLFLVGE